MMECIHGIFIVGLKKQLSIYFMNKVFLNNILQNQISFRRICCFITWFDTAHIYSIWPWFFCLQFVDFLQWQSVVETFDYLYILIIFWLTYQTITALAQTLPCLDKDFAIFSCLYKKLGCLCFAGYGVAKKLKTRLYRRAKSWFTRRIVYV